jgi:epsilon-lactone hydrolase
MASNESRAVEAMYREWTRRTVEPRPDDLPQNPDQWGDITVEPGGVDYVEADGIPALWVIPKGSAADRVILYFHGGGYVGGTLYTHRKMIGHLAKAAGVRALVATYRHTPQYPYPAQLNDTTAAYEWLLQQGFQHIAVGGDSAGGALAVTTLLNARNKGLPIAAALLLLSPWVDLELKGATYETNKDRDGFFYRDVVRGLVTMFMAGGSLTDPLANPLYADLTGLPPMYIQAGEYETVLDDARMLEKHARNSGVEVQLDIFAEQQHTFQMAAGYAPEADEAIQRFAGWVRPKLGMA